MATHTTWFCTILAVFATLICANRVDASSMARVRSESPLLRTVIANARDYSVTFQSLLERIEQSDVIVFLTCHRFEVGALGGQTALTVAHPGVRYLRVQVACQQSEQLLVAIVAHELQHVVEIAANVSVVDEQTFRRLFSAIGFQSCLSPSGDQFETTAAIETGDRVRMEYRSQSKIAKEEKRRARLSAGRGE